MNIRVIAVFPATAYSLRRSGMNMLWMDVWMGGWGGAPEVVGSDDQKPHSFYIGDISVFVMSSVF